MKDETELRSVLSVIRGRGLKVRRELLARGQAFRVKSGSCQVFGQDVLFVDKKLPARQQVAVIIDYLVDRGLTLSGGELSAFSPANRQLLALRSGSA